MATVPVNLCRKVVPFVLVSSSKSKTCGHVAICMVYSSRNKMYIAPFPWLSMLHKFYHKCNRATRSSCNKEQLFLKLSFNRLEAQTCILNDCLWFTASQSHILLLLKRGFLPCSLSRSEIAKNNLNLFFFWSAKFRTLVTIVTVNECSVFYFRTVADCRTRDGTLLSSEAANPTWALDDPAAKLSVMMFW